MVAAEPRVSGPELLQRVPAREPHSDSEVSVPDEAPPGPVPARGQAPVLVEVPLPVRVPVAPLERPALAPAHLRHRSPTAAR